MAENIRPTSLSPVLKDTSSLYSETANFLVNSGEDTVDRLLQKRGLSMTPNLEDISRSPGRSFVHDSCIDEYLMTPKSPLGLKNKRLTFRLPKRGSAKSRTTKSNAARFSTAFLSSAEENSMSDASLFQPDKSNDKRKLRQTSTFRNLKRHTGTTIQDLSPEEEGTDSSFTSLSLVEDSNRKTNFRMKSKSATIDNAYDVTESTNSEASICISDQRKSSAFPRGPKKTQNQQNEAVFVSALFSSVSSESSSPELSISKRVRKPEKAKKFKRSMKDAIAEDGDGQNDFDDALCSDSFNSSVSRNKSQKVKEHFDDNIRDSLNSDTSTIKHSSDKEKSIDVSSRSSICLENNKVNFSTSADSNILDIENQKSLHEGSVSTKKSPSIDNSTITSQCKSSRSTSTLDNFDVSGIENQRSHQDGIVSTEKTPGSNSSRINSRQTSSRSASTSADPENINCKRYTYNNENELIPKTLIQSKMDGSFKSCSNASNTSIESSINDNEEEEECSIFFERSSILPSESDNELDEQMVNGSLPSYEVSKICGNAQPNQTFVKRNESYQAKTSSLSSSVSSEKNVGLQQRSCASKSALESESAAATPNNSPVANSNSSSSSNGKKASLRQRSSSIESMLDSESVTRTPSTVASLSLSSSSGGQNASFGRRSSTNKNVSSFITSDFSTVADFSMFASNQFENSSNGLTDSGFSLRDNVKMSNNTREVIGVDLKDGTTELDFEGTSKLGDLSMKSLADENMRLHITDDPAVCDSVPEPPEINEYDASAGKLSIGNAQNSENDLSHNHSVVCGTSINSSKTRRSQATSGNCEPIAKESLNKSGNNIELSRRKTSNSSRHSLTPSSESFEITANVTLNSSRRALRKRKSNEETECQKNKLSAANQLELSRGTVEKAVESINETVNKSVTENTRNAELSEVTNDPHQDSVKDSVCGETFASATASQNERSLNHYGLKDESNSEYFSSGNSCNETPTVKSTAAGIPASTNFNEYFAKPLFPVSRRVGSLRRSRSSINSTRSSGSLSLLSKCIRKKRERKSSIQNRNQPAAQTSYHKMSLRKRHDAFPKSEPVKMSRPAYWVTNKLYSFLIEKLKLQFNILAKKRAENFVNFLQDKFKKLLKAANAESEDEIISAVKDQMVELRLVNSEFMFYNFVLEYLPFEIQDKVVPCAVPFSEKCSRPNFNPDCLFVKFF